MPQKFSAAEVNLLMQRLSELMISDPKMAAKAAAFREKVSLVSQHMAKTKEISPDTQQIAEETPAVKPVTGLRNRKHPVDTQANKTNPYGIIEPVTAAPRKAKPYEVSPSIRSMTKTFLQQALGLPGLGLGATFSLAQLFPVAADLPPDLAIVHGNGGGEDQCDALNTCIQNALMNMTSNEVLAVFGSSISVTGTGGQSSSAFIQVDTCFTHDVLAGVITKVYDAVGSVANLLGGAECSSLSGVWQGTQVKGSTTGLSTEACFAFQNSENKAADICQQFDNSASAIAIGLGGWAAIITVVCVCMCACTYMGHRHHKNRRNRLAADNANNNAYIPDPDQTARIEADMAARYGRPLPEAAAVPMTAIPVTTTDQLQGITPDDSHPEYENRYVGYGSNSYGS